MGTRRAPRMLVDVVRARPGRFRDKVDVCLLSNSRLTHVDLVCEVCGVEQRVRAETWLSEVERFDGHSCKPKSEWPAPMEEPGPAPRVSPAERRPEREIRRRGRAEQ